MEELFSLFGFDFINPIPPSGEAAFHDFFADQLFFGMLIMALGTMSIFATEIENGSIIFSLSRPISRSEYTTAKIFARVIALVIPFVVASLIGWIYMAIIFEVFPLDRLIWTLLPLIFLFTYLGVLTCFLSTKISTITAGLSAIAIIIVQFAISAFEPLELLSPITSANMWRNFLLNPYIDFNHEILLNFVHLGCWILVPFILTIFSMKTRDL
jgi:ABC-type transport system involved in multi-copper enzyme maturation permease subunit